MPRLVTYAGDKELIRYDSDESLETEQMSTVRNEARDEETMESERVEIRNFREKLSIVNLATLFHRVKSPRNRRVTRAA